jgi:hypothetical protein
MPRTAARRLVPLAVVAAMAAGVIAAGLALAGPVPVEDPNDVAGQLDVRAVSFDPEADPPRWDVVTSSSWASAEMWDRGFVLVYLDTTGNTRPDYYALIRSVGDDLEGSLWRDPRTGADRRLRTLDVSRGSDLHVTVRIPIERLRIGSSRTFYGWSIVTLYTGGACRATCIDRVPDDGAIRQPLGTPTPTPTPTSTPTPSTSASSSR